METKTHKVSDNFYDNEAIGIELCSSQGKTSREWGGVSMIEGPFQEVRFWWVRQRWVRVEPKHVYYMTLRRMNTMQALPTAHDLSVEIYGAPQQVLLLDGCIQNA